MPSTSIWIHLIWATKNRSTILTKQLRETLFLHIGENARAKEIRLDTIGGISDHVHLLVRLMPDQQVSKIVQLIKEESSHWVLKLVAVRLNQRAYAATASISFRRSGSFAIRRDPRPSGMGPLLYHSSQIIENLRFLPA